jgi:hypothetical protein
VERAGNLQQICRKLARNFAGNFLQSHEKLQEISRKKYSCKFPAKKLRNVSCNFCPNLLQVCCKFLARFCTTVFVANAELQCPRLRQLA